MNAGVKGSGPPLTQHLSLSGDNCQAQWAVNLHSGSRDGLHVLGCESQARSHQHSAAQRPALQRPWWLPGTFKILKRFPFSLMPRVIPLLLSSLSWKRFVTHKRKMFEEYRCQHAPWSHPSEYMYRHVAVLLQKSCLRCSDSSWSHTDAGNRRSVGRSTTLHSMTFAKTLPAAASGDMPRPAVADGFVTPFL